jgi:hypothetical protein
MLTVEILKPSTLRSLLSGENPATELSQLSTQLRQRHHFSASLAELNRTAKSQLTGSPQLFSFARTENTVSNNHSIVVEA